MSEDRYDDEGRLIPEHPVFTVAAEDDLALAEVRQTLARLRKERRIPQRRVAAFMSTSQSQVSDIEHGRVNMQVATLQAYARAIGAKLVIRVDPHPDGPP